MEISSLYKDSQRLKWKLQAQLDKAELSDELSQRDGRRLVFLQTDYEKTVAAIRKLSRDEVVNRTMWMSRLEALEDDQEMFREDYARLREKYLSSDPEHQEDDEYVDVNPVEEINQQNAIVRRSVKVLRGIRGVAGGALETLGQTRDILKHTQRSLYGLGVSLGMSDDTIRMIQRRLSFDSVIVYGGMCLVTLLILFFAWRLFRSS